MTTQTVYIERKVSEGMPERKAEYFIIVGDYKSVGIFDGTNFFSNDDKIDATVFFEKKEDQVCMSLSDFLKAISDALDKGEEICDANTVARDGGGWEAVMKCDEKQIEKDKQQYISNLLKQ